MEDNFVHQNMMTYIGNKRKLIQEICSIIETMVYPTLEKKKLNIVDGFAGSGVVSRALLQFADEIYINDMEPYSSVMSESFFKIPDDKDKQLIYHHIDTMNKISKSGPFKKGIISLNYCPEKTEDIKENERCFYTQENGQIIDTLRDYIEDQVEERLKPYCMSQLLIKASIHSNTAGVFKGFYKNKETKKGAFGGNGSNDLMRIKKSISLEYPIWSTCEYIPHIYTENINTLIQRLPDNIDIIYLDPPYNQHPYSSNYFMLNVIMNNTLPSNISKVSGIPKGWTRSEYNYKKTAIPAMKDLLHESLQKSKYVLLSYNNEGIIQLKDWDIILNPYNVTKKEILYNTYKGSRNLKERNQKVIEIMYLITK